MKLSIRRNVFETNSSNEHSLTIINESTFQDWKQGKLLARVIESKEDPSCTGNFWSKFYYLEFTNNLNKSELNSPIIEEIQKQGLLKEELYKTRCLEYVKKIKQKLSLEELDKLSDKERDIYEMNLLEDEANEFDKDNYDFWVNIYKHIKQEKVFDEYFGYINYKLWMTYDDFIKEMEVDCYSMFEHYDPQTNTHIIGKYFRS